MKKKALIIILIGILFLFSGIFLYVNRKSDVRPNNGPVILSRDEAVSVITQLINDVIKVYESPSSIFKTSDDALENDKLVFKLENYSEVISLLFSDNGIKQLESTVFNKENFIIKKDGNVYCLKEIPVGNQYIKSKISIDQVTSIKEKEISCEVTFSSYNLDEAGVINYYVVTKNIVVVKRDNGWVIDNFDYSNEW